MAGQTFTENGVTYEDLGNGQVRVVGYAQAAPSNVVAPNPVRAAREAQEAARQAANDARAEAREERSNRTEERSTDAAERTAANSGKDFLLKLSQDYNSDPNVKAYRVAIQQFAQALNTGTGPQADLALTYAFAKAMDPESVVRESEQGMVEGSQPWFQSAVEKVKKNFGYDEAGGFTPQARDALRKQISNSVAQRAKIYDARRNYIEKQAAAIGVDPMVVLGEHDAAPFVPAIQDWVKRANGEADGQQADDELDKAAEVPDQGLPGLRPENEGGPDLTDPEEGLTGTVTYEGPNTYETPGTYRDSYLGQSTSGINEAIGGLLGTPVDLLTAGMNVVPAAINAAANTNIPSIQDPVLGGDWWKDKMAGWAIYNPSNDPSKQFARRTAESLGYALPVAGFAKTGAQAATGLLSGVTGGMGAATAQQMYPGNPLAEMLGELIGGGATLAGGARQARNAAQRDINNAVPSIDDLKAQAGNVYQRAEQRGVTADPAMTTQLRDDFRQTLLDEGQLGPAGRISDADTNTTKAFNLIEQYAGQPMRPKQMDTIRGVIADGRKSPDASDQRLSKILLDQFDEFVRPLAPDFDEARDISSRYLQAEDLQEANELAGATAGQFTGAGYENALRTQYRALDKGSIRGKNWFDPDVLQAVQDVSRGTTASNAARAIGRFAPTGTVSAATTMGVPAAVASGVMGLTGPASIAIGMGAGALGAAGRRVATGMGIRNAELASLTARNGGALPQATIPAVFKDYAAMLAAVEQAKYLGQRPEQ